MSQQLTNGPPPAKLNGKARFGEILQREGLISEEQLQRALAIQERTGDRLGRILMSQGHINGLAVAQTLARQTDLPFQNLIVDTPDAEAVHLIDEGLARTVQAVPLERTNGRVTVGFVDPLDENAWQAMSEALDAPVDGRVISDYDLQWILDRVYRAIYLRRSVAGLYYRRPDESAYQTFTIPQLATLFLLLAAALTAGLLWPIPTLIVLNTIVTLVYLSITAYRSWLLYRGISLSENSYQNHVQSAEPADRDLPIYTILVPLFREEDVLPVLLQAIADIDYPPSKLDVMLLFEESDKATMAKAKALRPPRYFQFVRVPNSTPQTKPKACNYGLIRAVGDYCVIYDAEDIPEVDQLRKVVTAFRQAPSDVVCIQCRLNFFNREQNLLTRWFAAEYSMWFDVFLPGLSDTGAPIPLGGTSNHFVTNALRDLGGWDPFNVTEDADLGIRLHRAGYRTGMLASTTFEEANSRLGNWVRQRSRWIKGYMQTWLVHMRHPLRLWREMGTKSFLIFQATVLGTFYTLLVNPWYWFTTIMWLLTRWDIIHTLYPGFLYYLSLISLVVGNFYFLYFTAAATYMRGFYSLVRYTLLAPLYWALMSVGAWRGLWQLFRKPFYWEKTIHGLTNNHEGLNGNGSNHHG